MKKMKKWLSTLMGAVMLFCCTACDLPEKNSQNAMPVEKPAATIVQQETTLTTTTVDNNFADKEAHIEHPRPTNKQNISVGSKGDDVRWVQAALNKTLGADIDVDGDFGNTTKKYVKEFQNRAGLTPLTARLARKQSKSLLLSPLVKKSCQMQLPRRRQCPKQ